MTGYANWQSDEVESLVPVGSTPTSVTDNLIPWSNDEDAWVTTRKVMVRFHPGSLKSWAARPTGRCLACNQEIGVRFPGRSTESGR
jgi:hypothetical protein